MVVLGVGIDLVAVGPFAEQLGSAGSAFAELTFTPGELRSVAGPGGAAQHLAGRFAAKEAFVKAFSGARAGHAPAVADLDWREVEVIADAWGRPALMLHGALARAVTATLGPVNPHVSITHEPAMAVAVVVLERAA
ncbi:MAG: holo-ACP synthase [Candidatus Nanopelagicales bacterium]